MIKGSLDHKKFVFVGKFVNRVKRLKKEKTRQTLWKQKKNILKCKRIMIVITVIELKRTKSNKEKKRKDKKAIKKERMFFKKIPKCSIMENKTGNHGNQFA